VRANANLKQFNIVTVWSPEISRETSWKEQPNLQTSRWDYSCFCRQSECWGC